MHTSTKTLDVEIAIKIQEGFEENRCVLRLVAEESDEIILVKIA